MDHEFYGPAYEAPEDDFCDCEEDKICEPCRARHTRHAIQAGLQTAFAALPAPAMATAQVEDELLVDAAIADRRMNTVPALRGFGTPARRPAIAAIGNGLYVSTRRSA